MGAVCSMHCCDPPDTWPTDVPCDYYCNTWGPSQLDCECQKYRSTENCCDKEKPQKQECCEVVQCPKECKAQITSVSKATTIIETAFDAVLNAVIKSITSGGSLNKALKTYKPIATDATQKAYSAVELKFPDDCSDSDVEFKDRSDAVKKIIKDQEQEKLQNQPNSAQVEELYNTIVKSVAQEFIQAVGK